MTVPCASVGKGRAEMVRAKKPEKINYLSVRYANKKTFSLFLRKYNLPKIIIKTENKLL